MKCFEIIAESKNITRCVYFAAAAFTIAADMRSMYCVSWVCRAFPKQRNHHMTHFLLDEFRPPEISGLWYAIVLTPVEIPPVMSDAYKILGSVASKCLAGVTTSREQDRLTPSTRRHLGEQSVYSKQLSHPNNTRSGPV